MRFAGSGRARNQEVQDPNIRGGTGNLVACLLFRLAGQLRDQLAPHLLEFLPLTGLEDLKNPAQSGGTQIVELILQALVVVAVVLQYYGDLIGLLSGEIQLGLEILEYSIAV